MKAISTSNHWHTQALSCILIIVLLTVCVHGQSREQRVFDAIPEPLRAQLVERLRLYVEYQRTRQYEGLYDLLSESTIAQVYRGQSRVEFVAAYQRADAEGRGTRLLEFTPTDTGKTVRDNVDIYDIYGRAKLCEEGEIIEKQVVIQAQLQNGTWYFSALGEVLID